jgi:DNA-binding transcriptional LysR family regulator
MDLKRLRYFVAVAEEAHFGRAALRLGISQPPLSEHIQALEGELGAKLLFRTTRAVSLTAEGEALLEHARTVLREADRCREVINASRRRESASLTLGLLHAFSYTFLPALLRDWFAQDSQRRVHLVEYTTTEQVGRLLEGAIDIGLVREPIYHASLRTRSLFTEPYAVAVPAPWRLDRGGRLSVKALDGRSMIGYPSHDVRRSTQSLFRDFFHRYDVHPSDYFEVRTMHASLALVAAGRGFAPVPRSQAALRLEGVKYCAFREPAPELSVGLAWREDKATPMLQDFIAVCERHFAQEPAVAPPRR